MRTSAGGRLAAGTVIAGCRIERHLGTGGMGEVYLATHQRLDTLVALKLLPRTAGDNPDSVARFRQEARLAARVGHPNVIKILDVGEERGEHYIVMDYVDGTDLKNLVERQGGPLPWRQAVRLVQLAARGVAAVHQHDLIHRDIKPANIMLSRTQQVLLMDFGLVRAAGGSDRTRTGAVVGTPAFMSPEQCRGEKTLDRRSDVFSLGSTLYYLVTGGLPYDGTSAFEVCLQIAQGKVPPPAREKNPFVPKEVSELIRRAMAHRPADRPADAAALARELGAVLKAADPPSPAAHDTDDVSSMRTAPLRPPIPEMGLVPLHTLPHESPFSRVKPYLPWVGAGLAICLSGVAMAIALNRPGRADVNRPKDGPPVAVAPPPPARPGMVLIPAGGVQMGNTAGEMRRHALTLDFAKDDELLGQFLRMCTTPPRTASVPAFWMDKYEVTNAEYEKFVAATGRQPPEHWKGLAPPPELVEHPVVNVTWADATAYAAWAGKKLPTEEQWVRAHRGDQSLMYPWGDRWEADRANTNENRQFPGTSPVTATPRDVSAAGVYNLVGNVCEYIRDRSQKGSELVVVSRGAFWDGRGRVYGVAAVRSREIELDVNPYTGFRCVADGP